MRDGGGDGGPSALLSGWSREGHLRETERLGTRDTLGVEGRAGARWHGLGRVAVAVRGESGDGRWGGGQTLCGLQVQEIWPF